MKTFLRLYKTRIKPHIIIVHYDNFYLTCQLGKKNYNFKKFHISHIFATMLSVISVFISKYTHLFLKNEHLIGFIRNVSISVTYN